MKKKDMRMAYVKMRKMQESYDDTKPDDNIFEIEKVREHFEAIGNKAVVFSPEFEFWSDARVRAHVVTADPHPGL